jgi:hypothetical protein
VRGILPRVAAKDPVPASDRHRPLQRTRRLGGQPRIIREAARVVRVQRIGDTS